MQSEGVRMKGGSLDMNRRKISPKECALMAVVVILGILFLPVVVILYCIPSVRKGFNSLLHEDAMRG